MPDYTLRRGLGQRRAGATINVDGPHARTLHASGHIDLDQHNGTDDPFDPNDHTADEVTSYLDTLDLGDTDEADEAERVIAAETAGKDRKTVVSHLNGDANTGG